jgi:hypothetical protein
MEPPAIPGRFGLILEARRSWEGARPKIGVLSDGELSAFEIAASSAFDLPVTHDVRDVSSGQPIGSIERKASWTAAGEEWTIIYPGARPASITRRFARSFHVLRDWLLGRYVAERDGLVVATFEHLGPLIPLVQHPFCKSDAFGRRVEVAGRTRSPCG